MYGYDYYSTQEQNYYQRNQAADQAYWYRQQATQAAYGGYQSNQERFNNYANYYDSQAKRW